jgi:hypothetical protein
VKPHVQVGAVPVGTPVESVATVKNRSAEDLTLSTFEVFGQNGGFTLSLPGDCGPLTILAPKASCTFGIVTSPIQKGPIRGTYCVTGVGTTIADRECGEIKGRGTVPRG